LKWIFAIRRIIIQNCIEKYKGIIEAYEKKLADEEKKTLLEAEAEFKKNAKAGSSVSGSSKPVSKQVNPFRFTYEISMS
jgi:hypothetical protein